MSHASHAAQVYHRCLGVTRIACVTSITRITCFIHVTRTTGVTGVTRVTRITCVTRTTGVKGVTGTIRQMTNCLRFNQQRDHPGVDDDDDDDGGNGYVEDTS